MVKLKAKGLKWLKGFHLIAVSCWVGGGVALILLYFLKNGVNNGNVLYGINQSIHQQFSVKGTIIKKTSVSRTFQRQYRTVEIVEFLFSSMTLPAP